MNRWDEIQGAARDVADWVCADPADRNRMANELIRLVALVVKATGKGVAVAGESAMNGPDAEADAGGGRYLVGEDLQRAAEEVREEATGADIERYERDGLTPVWRPDPAKRRPSVDDVARRATDVIVRMGDDIRELTGQRDRYRAAWLNARARAKADRPAPFTTGPFAPGELTRLAHEAADAMREQHKTPVPDERLLFAPGAEQYYRDVLGLGPKPCDTPGAGPVRCGECNQVLGFGHMFGCPHRIPAGATKDVPVPVVLHTWVTATDGDTGATLDYVHCGVCGVRKCDGGCGDATVGATPDIDCATHGNDQARQCVERCRGCGDPVDNGRAHGPNQGFGGCC